MKSRWIAIGTLLGAILPWIVLDVAPGLSEPPPSSDPSTAPFPGPSQASEKVEGQLLKIDGRYFVVKDLQGKYVRLLVTEDTRRSREFTPGDRIVVWTTPIEHALAIRAVVQPADREEETGKLKGSSRRIRGVLKEIQGQFYVVQDSQGREVRVQLSEDTELTGKFSPGEQLEILLSP